MLNALPLGILDVLWLNCLWLTIGFKVFVLFTMQRLLRLIQPSHRCCSPNTLWWCLIPFVGNFVLFPVTRRLSKSLSRQFAAMESHRLFHGFSDRSSEDFGATRGRYWALFGIAFDIFCLYVIHNVGRWSDLLRFEFIYMVVILILISQSYFYWTRIRKAHLRLIGFMQSAKSAEELDYLE